MKLIKLMMAIVMALAMVVAQDTGDNPCDPNMTYPIADPGPEGGCGDYADCNGNGAYDMGEPCFEGPPPFEAVDTNGDGSIDRDEARAMFGQDDEGNPDPEFDAEYDRIAGDDGMVDHAEYMAADDGGGDHDGGGTCDVCGHEYGGPDDHHGHCRVCGAEMNTDDDWRAHCDDNWEHCKAQAGDTCGYVGPNGGDECGYVHTGDPDEDHHHCDTCGMPVNSGDEMGAHCDENPGHCHDDGPPPFEDVDSNGDGSIDREEARNFFGDEPNFDEEYDKVDANGDGMVDHDEYMASDGGDHEGGDGDDGPPPFEDVDSNGDGSIDREEARNFFGDEPNFDEEYDKVDANGDGMVDHDEYMASDGGDHEGGDGDDGPPPFEDVDSNGDGSIDREEARDYFGDEPNFDEEYDKVDANGDGMVDHDEYMAADDGGPPTNHWDGNCGAMSHGESEYWLDSDGDPNNGAEDGPYAVWYEDADGNSVDCGPGPQ